MSNLIVDKIVNDNPFDLSELTDEQLGSVLWNIYNRLNSVMINRETENETHISIRKFVNRLNVYCEMFGL